MKQNLNFCKNILFINCLVPTLFWLIDLSIKFYDRYSFVAYSGLLLLLLFYKMESQYPHLRKTLWWLFFNSASGHGFGLSAGRERAALNIVERINAPQEQLPYLTATAFTSALGTPFSALSYAMERFKFKKMNRDILFKFIFCLVITLIFKIFISTSQIPFFKNFDQVNFLNSAEKTFSALEILIFFGMLLIISLTFILVDKYLLNLTEKSKKTLSYLAILFLMLTLFTESQFGLPNLGTELFSKKPNHYFLSIEQIPFHFSWALILLSKILCTIILANIIMLCGEFVPLCAVGCSLSFLFYEIFNWPLVWTTPILTFLFVSLRWRLPTTCAVLVFEIYNLKAAIFALSIYWTLHLLQKNIYKTSRHE